jgi:DNA processing protein
MQVSPLELRCEELLGPLNQVETKFAPQRVFVAGDTDILKTGFRVAIVGSRAASREGLKRARKLAVRVIEAGGVVVSGLARGIDTAAHNGAIEAGGKTVAVIGTPLDQSYPPQNTSLQELIQREHLCISQFPPGYSIKPQNFPMRNRTMALFSDATAIVEAGETSGSINQGWEALRLGRGLFISKSLVDHPELKWPQRMIAYGAQVLSDESVEDLLESLPDRDLTFELNAVAF